MILKNGFAQRNASRAQVLKAFGDIPRGGVFSHDLSFSIDALMNKRKDILDLGDTFYHFSGKLGNRNTGTRVEFVVTFSGNPGSGNQPMPVHPKAEIVGPKRSRPSEDYVEPQDRGIGIYG